MRQTNSNHRDAASAAFISPRFRRAAAAVVEDARVLVGDVAWLVTRSDGDDLIVLCAVGEETTAKEGERIRMRPDEDVSVPLELPDGSVFGALCALGAAPSRHAALPLPQVQRLADLLTVVLSVEWDAHKCAERAHAESLRAVRNDEEVLHDGLTGLANRRAWVRAMEAEERRCRRYGTHAAVIVVDVDDLNGVNNGKGHAGGDHVLRNLATVLETMSRDSDVVARTGGDEFGVLALDCAEPHLRVLTSRVRRALADAGVGASVGGACRVPGFGLPQAWAEADAAMNADKHRRRVHD
jgi:diguanylate cyclase